MAIDLAKLIQPQWVFRADDASEWDVFFYSVKAAIEVERYTNGEAERPLEVARALIGVMCKSHLEAGDNGDEEARAPTQTELSGLSEEELNRFAREFFENNTLREDEPEARPERKDEETDVEYLIRVLEDENRKNSAKLGDMFAGLNKSLGGLLDSSNSGIRNVTQDLISQSEGIDRQFGHGNSYFAQEPARLHIPTLPPNPAHETNDRLVEVTDRLGNLVAFGENALRIMNGLQVAAAEFLENFSNEADKNSIAARRAIGVGVLAILISLAQIGYTEFWRVPQDSEATEAAIGRIQTEIDELQTAVVSDLANSRSAEVAASQRLSEAIADSGSIDSAALARIEALLRQQIAQSAELIAAMNALAENLQPPQE
ncbi:MAG: hypothetical protein OIF47_02735 [Marinibacterium sp.]|nr:hypothetical protein [Marinibacterium sp.]